MNQPHSLSPSTPFKWTLLYYHYFSKKISIKERSELQAILITSAQTNKLVGRIRVAFDGINATLGGFSKSDLENHANEISSLQDFGFNTENTSIDFKYALSNGSRSIEAIEGCRFNTFEAKLVDEIVTMNLSEDRANPVNTGIHLSPIEFHNGILRIDTGIDTGIDTTNINTIKADVIIDVRNSYESAIGRFVPPSDVSLLVPNVRTFANMPSYFDSIEESIKGKNIFMYCTGGVRCERASAYIREKGDGFKNVYQLQGGVQRYLEAAERGDLSTIKDKTGELIDSSLWGGRLFVFDERRPVRLAGACPPPLSYRPSTRILSTCILCKKPWDEYEWLRCGQCSILVLVCDTCIQNGTTATIDDRSRLRCSTCSCSTFGDSTIKRRSSIASTEKPSIEELQKRKEEREQRGAERRAQLKNINNASSSSSLSSSSSILSVTDTDTDMPLFRGLFDDDNNS